MVYQSPLHQLADTGDRPTSACISRLYTSQQTLVTVRQVPVSVAFTQVSRHWRHLTSLFNGRLDSSRWPRAANYHSAGLRNGRLSSGHAGTSVHPANPRGTHFYTMFMQLPGIGDLAPTP